MWKVLKVGCLGLVAVMVVAVVAVVISKARADRHYYDGYDAKTPLNVVITSEEDRPEMRRTTFTYEGLPGLAVPSILNCPKEGGPFPCVIFLHGIGQDGDFVDEIAAPFVQAGFAIVSFDQYTQGQRKMKGLGPVGQLKAFQKRGALTPIETRRMIDFIETRPDMAKDRIYLCGASYGAMTGSAAAHFDHRFRAVVLCYGGGNLKLFLDNKEAQKYLVDEEHVNKVLIALVKPIGRILCWLLRPFDPINHAGGISPIPVLFQNGTHDILIPTATAKAFQEAAKDPKEIIWYDSNHVGMDRAHTEKVLFDAIAWMKKHEPAEAQAQPVGAPVEPADPEAQPTVPQSP